MNYVLADMDTFASQDKDPLELLLEKEKINLDNPEIGDIIEGKIKEITTIIQFMFCEIEMLIETEQGMIFLTNIASDKEARQLDCADIMGKDCDLIFTRDGWAFRNLYLI